MRNRYELGKPFRACRTAIDPASAFPYATDTLNARVADGAIRPRYGYKTLQGVPSGFTAGYGLFYLQGYSGSSEVEEYISFEHRGVSVRPYSRNATTGASTEITNGGSSLSLNASAWRVVAWQDVCYAVNPNDSGIIYKHTLGSATSWTTFGPPARPSTILGFELAYGAGNATTPYRTLSWAGLTVGSDITYAGNATSTNSRVDNTDLIIAHTGSPQESSFEINLSKTTAGNNKSFDWAYCDVFGIEIESGFLSGGANVGAGFRIDPESVRILLTNSDGTPILFQPTGFDFTYEEVGEYGFKMRIRAHFDQKTRSNWGDGTTAAASLAAGQNGGKTVKLKLSYRITSGSSAGTQYNLLRLAPLVIGGVVLADPRTEVNLRFGYSHYNSTSTQESGIGGLRLVSELAANGPAYWPNLEGFGTWLNLTGVNSSEADTNRLYVTHIDQITGKQVWKRAIEQADSSPTFLYRIAYWERDQLTTYNQTTPFTASGLKAGIPFRGWMVWLYKSGYQNVRHSRIGEPEKQASDYDLDEDLQAGATFSLADNYADEPETAFDCDGVLILCGQNALYAQQGAAPTLLTPPKRLPTSAGVANAFAAARYVSDNGLPGVAYVSRSLGGVYFAMVSSATDERSMQIIQLDKDIAGQVRAFLIDGQAALWTAIGVTTESGKRDLVRVWVDDESDSLWVAAGKRALVLRRENQIDGTREWEFYEYTTPSNDYIHYVAASAKRRVRWQRASGRMDENEWDTSALAWITGTNRDASLAIGSVYHEYTITAPHNTRLHDVYVERDTETDLTQITATSTRQTATKTIASGKRFITFGPLQQGYKHKLKIILGENHSPVRRLVVDILGPIGRGARR
ncbi:MAG TPA: hypothetical protein PKA27_02345 [Fimbriimonadaceae bacterium]|nr:hypothetical protein [Fimbriimonadaceae bacterium]